MGISSGPPIAAGLQMEDEPGDGDAWRKIWARQFRCPCGTLLDTRSERCWNCGREDIYTLTPSQARAVARELNRLKREHDEAERWVKIFSEEDARQYQKQPCGHERRFRVTGDDEDCGDPRGMTQWCALCELKGVRNLLTQYAGKHLSKKEATDETDTN